MFWFAGTAQEAAAGGRSETVDILVREVNEAIYINKTPHQWTADKDTKIPRSTTSSCFPCSSHERKHQVIKASSWEAETSWKVSLTSYDSKWVEFIRVKKSVILNIYAVSEPQRFQFNVIVERFTWMIARSFGCTTNRTSRNEVCGWSRLNLRNSFNITVATRRCGNSRLPVPIAGIAIDFNFFSWTSRKQLRRNWLKVCNITVTESIYVREY